MKSIPFWHYPAVLSPSSGRFSAGLYFPLCAEVERSPRRLLRHRFLFRISEHAFFHDRPDSALRKYRVPAGTYRRTEYPSVCLLLRGHQRGLRNHRVHHTHRSHRLRPVPLPAFCVPEVGSAHLGASGRRLPAARLSGPPNRACRARFHPRRR